MGWRTSRKPTFPLVHVLQAKLFIVPIYRMSGTRQVLCSCCDLFVPCWRRADEMIITKRSCHAACALNWSFSRSSNATSLFIVGRLEPRLLHVYINNSPLFSRRCRGVTWQARYPEKCVVMQRLSEIFNRKQVVRLQKHWIGPLPKFFIAESEST